MFIGFTEVGRPKVPSGKEIIGLVTVGSSVEYTVVPPVTRDPKDPEEYPRLVQVILVVL